MKVVFLEDVPGVALGGDVKEVKNGYARNYLIPKDLAVPATHDALQRIERLKRQAESHRLKTLSDMKALAKELEGVQVSIEMRAGIGGRLYGSVTNAVIAEELSKVTGRQIDRRVLLLNEPIRQLGEFDVRVHLHQEIEPEIKVLVHAVGTEPTSPPDDEPILEAQNIEAEVSVAESNEIESEGATHESE